MNRRSASIVTLLMLLVTAVVLVAIGRSNEVETAEAADPTATPAITEPPDTPTTVPPDESVSSGEAARRNLCQQGGAVGRQARFNELAADCAALLALKSTLAGTATLNWSPNVAVADWDGVTIKSRRVTALRLRDKSLTDGQLGPVGLEDLESGSLIVFDLVSGDELERQIATTPSTSSGANTPARDVGALFDQIARSVEER